MSKFTEKDVKKYLNDGNFCIAPWVHIQNTPEGVPQPCCIFKPNIIDGHTRRRLNDAFHGEEWDKLMSEFEIDSNIDHFQRPKDMQENYSKISKYLKMV